MLLKAWLLGLQSLDTLLYYLLYQHHHGDKSSAHESAGSHNGNVNQAKQKLHFGGLSTHFQAST